MEIFILKLTDETAFGRAVCSSVLREEVRLKAAVVVAADETTARQLCAALERKAMDGNQEEECDFSTPWLNSRLSSCEKLGTAESRAPGILLQESF